MNKFAEIKSILKGKEVVEHYLGLPSRKTSKGLWYKSPFRKEKTASFYVSEKGIHDFGCGEHYDIISFVVKYFNTDNYNALKILCHDFGLPLFEQKEDRETIKKLKAKRERERKQKEEEKRKFNFDMQKLCDDLQETEKLIRIFEQSSYFEVLKILYDKQAKLEIGFEQVQAKDKRRKIDGK